MVYDPKDLYECTKDFGGYFDDESEQQVLIIYMIIMNDLH